MKFEYEMSLLAIAYLDSIWNYTVAKWSISQAEKYYAQLFTAIDLVCSNPEIGKSLKEVKEHHRFKLVGSHMLIYKIERQKILVDRILHQRMNIDDELTE